MQLLSYLFFAALVVAFGWALRDCARSPGETARGWRRFSPVFVGILAIAAVFLAINLARLGLAESQTLISRALLIVSLAVGTSVFFCAGWPAVEHAGYAGLFERIRRRVAGRQTPPVGRALLEIAGVSGAIIVVSVGLFALLSRLDLVDPQPTEPFRRWIESRDSLDARSGFRPLFILLAPFWEETVFRWYILNRTRRRWSRWRWGRAAAIVASSALWSCGHVGLTEPAWIKLLQIFSVGCLLAWRFPVIGLSGCILVHLAMNLTALLPQALGRP